MTTGITTGQALPFTDQLASAMPKPPPEPFSEDFNVVLLGNLNPSIFHPEWFCRHELIGLEASSEAKISVVSPQVTEIDIGHIHLQCTDNRMILSTSRATHIEQLFDLIRGILAILPHTPLRAVGINHQSHYRAESERQWHNIGHQLAPKKLVWDQICEDPGMLKINIQSPRSNWDYPLKEIFTVEPYGGDHPKHPALNIQANTHFAIPDEEDHTYPTATDMASLFIETQWEDATKRARTVAIQIFNSIHDET
jgi:hypothetical protein